MRLQQRRSALVVVVRADVDVKDVKEWSTPNGSATAILVNENVDPPRQCEMRLMIDTSSGEELIISRRKAQQLHLVQFDERAAEGYGGRVQKMIVYRVVLVKLPSTASDGSQEIFKQAQLTVVSGDEAVDGEDDEEDLRNFAGFRQARVEGGALQLSSLMSLPISQFPEATLGGRGLAKLRLSVDPKHYRLYPITTPHLVV